MSVHTLPTTQGQICRFINPMPDEDPKETFILIVQPATPDRDEAVQIVSITHLQRNMYTAQNAPRNTVRKDELEVVGDDLKSFIESFNS